MYLMFNSTALFHIFSIFLVISSSMVILSKNCVFSLIFLVISFIISALLLLFLECEFLTLIFVIVYVGAIAILFLFSIMMLESKVRNLSKNSIKYFPLGALFGSLCVLPCVNAIENSFKEVVSFDFCYINIYQNWYDLIDATYEIKVYGQVLYSRGGKEPLILFCAKRLIWGQGHMTYTGHPGRAIFIIFLHRLYSLFYVLSSIKREFSSISSNRFD